MNSFGEKFPFEIHPLDDEIQKKVNQSFRYLSQRLVQVGINNWLLPDKFESFADEIYNFEARPDDVFISTLPRSGTTWTQEMIWLICNNLDYETAQRVALTKRFPFMDLHIIASDQVIERRKANPEINVLDDLDDTCVPLYDYFTKQTSRRFIKTHLPIQLMPRNIKEVGAKVIYVARNPKDVAVSFFHLQRSPFFGYEGSFEDYADLFMNDLTIYAPYWKHVLNGWNHRNDDNVHFMFYEDSQFEMCTSLQKLAKFLDKPLRDEDLPKLMNHLHIDNARKNPALNQGSEPEDGNKAHIRRGKVGGNPEMTEEISEKFDKWTEESLKGVDFKFPNDR